MNKRQLFKRTFSSLSARITIFVFFAFLRAVVFEEELATFARKFALAIELMIIFIDYSVELFFGDYVGLCLCGVIL